MNTRFRFNGARQRVSRRSVVKGGALGTVGLFGAALVGCGEGEPDPADRPPDAPAAPAATPDPEAVNRGGVLRVGTTEDVTTLDLHQTASLIDVQAVTVAYDQLLQYDPFDHGAIIGNLAHEWELPDETTIVFHLNQATFHDGAPFTSEDVVASFERQKDPPSGVTALRQANFDVVDRIEAPDERTAIFHMQRPSGAFLSLMAVSYMNVLSARDIRDDSFDHQERINGTGPFMLERYDRGSRMSYSRNPNYYDEGLPYLDGVEMFIVPEEVTRMASFRSGDLDIFGPSAIQAEEIERMAGATLLVATHFSWYTHTIATWKEPWTDPRTWAAVSLTTDRDAQNQAISNGRGFTGGGLPPGGVWALPDSEMEQFPGFSGDLETRRAEARQLLDAAGVPEGTSVSVFGRGGATAFENHAVLFADGLEHIGLTTNITLEERATYDQRLGDLDYGDMAANSRNAAMDDPTPVYAENFIEGAGRHYSGLVIPEVEDLFLRQESELDHEARLELAHQMQRAYLGTYPVELGHNLETRLALHDDVQGYGALYGNARASRKLQWVWLDR